MTSSPFPTQHFQIAATQRHLAFSEAGDAQGKQVLLCLPGLLETRTTFDPLLQAAANVRGLRVISLDLCGRGDSDTLLGDTGYSMQVYLSDVLAFIKHLRQRSNSNVPVMRLELLGTSMGGILAMYLTQQKEAHIDGLCLNDIGLNLPWLSIYGLYDSMKKEGRLPAPEVIAQQLRVSLGAVVAVQSPAHFDLPYHKDFKGMKFGHLLRDFHGSVSLIRGAQSGVCSLEQVRHMKRELPQCRVLEVAGAGHPAPFTPEVCAFVLQGLAQALVLPETVAAKEQREAHERGFWPWLKQRYRAAITK